MLQRFEYGPRETRAKSGLRRLILAFVAIAAGILALAYWQSGRHLDAGRAALRDGRWSQAEAAFQAAYWWRLRRTTSLEGLGVASLGMGSLAFRR